MTLLTIIKIATNLPPQDRTQPQIYEHKEYVPFSNDDEEQKNAGNMSDHTHVYVCHTQYVLCIAIFSSNQQAVHTRYQRRRDAQAMENFNIV